MAGGSGTVFSTFGAKDHLGGRSTGVHRYEGTTTVSSPRIGPALNGADPYQRDPRAPRDQFYSRLSAAKSEQDQGSPAVRYIRFGQDLERREGRWEREVEEGGGRRITIRQFQYLLAWQPDVALVSYKISPAVAATTGLQISCCFLTLMFDVGLLWYNLFRPWGPCFSRRSLGEESY